MMSKMPKIQLGFLCFGFAILIEGIKEERATVMYRFIVRENFDFFKECRSNTKGHMRKRENLQSF